MPGGPGPRLALEAAFIVAVVVIAAVADVRPLGIALIAAGAWLIAALYELALWREVPRYYPGVRRYTYPPPAVAPPQTDELLIVPFPPEEDERGVESATVVLSSEEVPAPAEEAEADGAVAEEPEPEPAPEPALEPRRRFWRRRRGSPTETDAQPASTLHVRKLEGPGEPAPEASATAAGDADARGEAG